MKANELRIGNWVFRTELSKTFHSKISAYTLSCAGHDGIIDFLSPIPLTPEILEKAGFVKDSGIDVYKNGRLRVWVGARGKFLCYLIEENTTTGHYIPNSFVALHQLQNLYFALTGEELNISL